MIKLTLGMALVMTTSIFANEYVTSYPANAERIGAIIAVRDVTKSLSEKLTDLQGSSYDLRMLKTSSKLKFCMNVGEVSSLNSLLAKKIEDITPPPPAMYNHQQSEFLDTSRELRGTISEKIHPLKSYCSGERKLEEDYRNQIVNDMSREARNAFNEYAIQNPSNALLAPMTVDELRKVNEQESDQDIIIEKKNCTLF